MNNQGQAQKGDGAGAQNAGPVGNRIYLSFGDHNKKRFKPVVTTKTSEDQIILADISYDIPEVLIDQKYLSYLS